MVNRRKASDDIARAHLDTLSAAEESRERAVRESLAAEETLRRAIRDAFSAGLTVGQIRTATTLSESRIYQIRDGRR